MKCFASFDVYHQMFFIKTYSVVLSVAEQKRERIKAQRPNTLIIQDKALRSWL